MVGIQLQIHFFDDINPAGLAESYVRSWFSNNGFAVLKWNVVGGSELRRQVTHSDESVRVECELRGDDSGKQKIALQDAWCSEPVPQCLPSLQPWLCIVEDCRRYATYFAFDESIPLRSVLLGTLPWPSTFVFHQHIPIYRNSGCPRAYFKHRRLGIVFSAPCVSYGVKIPKECKLEVFYSSIRQILVTKSQSGFLLILTLIHPPVVLYTEIASPFTNGTTWQRILNPRGVPLEHIGMTSAVALSFSSVATMCRIVDGLQSECRNVTTHYVSVQVVSDWLQAPDADMGDFGCSYLLLAILWRNNVLVLQNRERLKELLGKLRQWASDAPGALEKALTEALEKLDAGCLVDYGKLVERLFWHHHNVDAANRDPAIDSQPEDCVLVRHVFLTPSRILLWPPGDVFSNRVLRNFDPDYALRVSFREENMNMLYRLSCHHHRSVLGHVIQHPMTKGLELCSRRYQFLAWSNSQLRDHGTWMYATDSAGNSASSIRKWMGNFANIRNVPKLMARMGQCFSHSKATIFVPLNSQVTVEPDILGPNNPNTWKPYCFSDGIGRISEKLAVEVCDILKLTYMPSAYQIRYAGFKGMLVLDPTLQDKRVILRQSMKKFDCTYDKLEIVKTSAPCNVQLNRPLITILEQTGIPAENLLRMQEGMLLTLTELLLDEQKAAEYLGNQTPLEKMNFKALVAAGVSLTTEPFFRGMLVALHNRDLAGMRAKARLSVDPALGRNMYGVLDETGRLEYGQVFIQYSTDLKVPHGQMAIVTGPVLVTKNPCLQPGDIRLLVAVDVEELRHIVDCIAFPQKGPRPHPDEMNGSDLDGDEYTVIWDPALLGNPYNYPARNLPYTPENKLEKTITVKDMIACFCHFVEKDQLGLIAQAHLAQADQQGLCSPACQGLANKLSVTVDFAKTGCKIEGLEADEKPLAYPDFMETGRSYHSKRVLGSIYRFCVDFERGHRATASAFYSDVQVDPDLVYPGWETYQEQAKIEKEAYNRSLESICRRYDIAAESELMAGAFGKIHDLYRGRRDRLNAEEMIINCVRTLRKNVRGRFYQEFQVPEDGTSAGYRVNSEQLRKKASAWYVETYQDTESQRFLSFPWCVENILRSIKHARGSKVCRLLRSPTLSRLNCTISSMESNFSGPEPLLTNYLETHGPISSTVKRCLRTVILWAWHSGLSKVVDRSEETVANIFLHVASRPGEAEQEVVVGDVAEMFVDFLRFCMSLGFQSEAEVSRLSFKVPNRKELARCCMQAYRSLAISGGSLPSF